MSFLKKPFRKIKTGLSGHSEDAAPSPVNSAPSKEEGINGSFTPPQHDGNSTPTATATSKRQSRELSRDGRKSMDGQRSTKEHKKEQSLARIEDEKFLQEGPADLTRLYKPYSMIQSKHWRHEQRTLFKEIDFAGECHAGRAQTLLTAPQQSTATPSPSELACTPCVE